MAQIIDIRRVEVGPRSLTARVRVATTAPLYTSEDLQGTARVYHLMPHIIEHACLGDASETFRDVMGDTELAHLLEHVTVELLAQSDIAGDISSGRTFAVEGERRTYDVEIACPDDVLVAGALSSAVWIMQWAFSGGTDPEPDVAATVQGLVGLVQTLPEPEASKPSVVEYVVSEEEAEALIAENAIFSNDPVDEFEESEGIDEPEGSEPEPAYVYMTPDGVHESPEARQAAQDSPAMRVNPDEVPVVPPAPEPEPEDPFDTPIYDDEPVPEAEFEELEDEVEPAVDEVPAIDEVSEAEIEAAMAEVRTAASTREAEPVSEAEPYDDQVEEPEPEPVEEPEPEPVEEPEAEPVAEPEPVEDEAPQATDDAAIESELAPDDDAEAPVEPVLEQEAAAEEEAQVVAEAAEDVVDIVEEEVAPLDGWDDEDDAAAAESQDFAEDEDADGTDRPSPAGVSWSTLSPSATGEWGSIPEPRFVR